MYKKGISGVVVTVLMILVVLAAIVLIWTFIRAGLEDPLKGIGSARTDIKLTVVSESVETNESNASIRFVLKKDEGNTDLNGFYVILQDVRGNTKEFRYNENIPTFGTREVNINYDSTSLLTIDKIYTASVFLDSSGREVVSSPTLGYEVLGGVKSYCGDGKVESYEQCDGSVGTTCEQASPYYLGGVVTCIPAGMRMQCTYNTSGCIKSDSLIAYFKFEEPSWTGAVGEVQDETNLHPSTIRGAGVTPTAGGIKGKAAYFPSGGGIPAIEISGKELFSFGESNFSISLWVNSESGSSTSGMQGFFSYSVAGASTGPPAMISYPGYYLGVLSNKLTFRIKNSSNVFPSADDTVRLETPMVYGKWMHLVAVKDEKKIRLYINGTEIGSTSIPYLPYTVNNPDAGTFPLMGAAYSWEHVNPMKGKLDEVLVFNRALSEKEVNQIYDWQKPV